MLRRMSSATLMNSIIVRYEYQEDVIKRAFLKRAAGSIGVGTRFLTFAHRCSRFSEKPFALLHNFRPKQSAYSLSRFCRSVLPACSTAIFKIFALLYCASILVIISFDLKK